MARISGVDLPKNKRGVIGLTYVFGLGKTSAMKILEEAGVDPDKKIKDWEDNEVVEIRRIIGDKYKVEGALRATIQLNIKRLMDIGCYRGLRHRKGLPLRGQRTRTNARTRKGRVKTVAGKKKAPKK
jgi:small subunit ribosomal protein S13